MPHTHSLWFYFQAFFSDNAAAQASRKCSPRVTNESVQKAVSDSFFIFLPFQVAILYVYVLTDDLISWFLRLLLWRVLTTAVLQMWAPDWMLSRRSSTFQFSLPPPLGPSLRPLNSEGSVVSTRQRSEWSDNSICFAQHVSFERLFNIFPDHAVLYRISEDEYVKAIKEEINKVVKLQEELDIDVLVHGEPEVWFPI